MVLLILLALGKFCQQNYSQQYQNQLLMENSKRRRGISLSHQQQPVTPAHPSLEKSVYVESQPTTRLQYPRYHLQSPSRHASAPKAKVHFAYPLHPTALTAIRAPIRHNDLSLPHDTFYVPPPPNKFVIGITPPPPSKPVAIPQETQISMSESLPLPMLAPSWEKVEAKLEPIIQLQESQPAANIPEKYSSFEQCKEAIGKRLFGLGSIVRRETALQETDRGNRWLQESKSSKQEVTVECKQTILEQTQKQVSQKIVLSQTSIEECVREVVKASERVEAPKQQKRQLNIQHEVVNFAAESKASKENAPPPTVSVSAPPKKKGRDPLKLQEMEKRLMEIIKICDENLT